MRVAAWLTLALAPAGLLLVLDGILELQWWGSAGATRLLALLDSIDTEYGIAAPALLRSREGAVELIVLGVFCLGYSLLGIWLLRGRLWARTWAFAAGAAAVLFGVIGVGGDATESRTLSTYFDALTGSVLTDRIPQVQALLYPGWYSWAEDIAQGLQLLLSLAAFAGLAAAVISHSDWFTGGRAVDAPPDDWDSALSRVREQSRRQREADS
ncbi:hypothetical protein Adu01nite_74440 [Paractinoplanes durhamensis]|uniref:Uncharacterized protein n=1 Tax=Paractinoplanes durhamensis TaxID=113563 RepID=A0ABQ3Z8E5_9ACTN|nr:hypothetical protein Adu01nite_74440 [Actinoplanes durhamensis]